MIARGARGRLIVLAASVALGAVVATCTQDPSGPARRGAFSVAPVLPTGASLAAFNLTLDRIRVIAVRPPADTALDTTVVFPPDQPSVSLSADVRLEQSPETFQVTVQLLSGTTLLFEGTQGVGVAAGQSSPPAQIPVTYAGPGQNIATLSLAPADSVLTFGGSLTFQPTAQDAQGNPVTAFYVSWSTSDPAVSIDATGTLVAPATRMIDTVTARTPTGITASTPITFVPVPTAIVAESGCDQLGTAGTVLPEPVVARVIAADGIGVRGVTVRFTAPAGGVVNPVQAVTDSAGLAQTAVTLGSVPGTTSLSIAAAGLTAVSCPQTALGATQLVFTTPPPPTVVAGGSFTIAVTAQDALGNPAASFTDSVTLALGTNPGGATFAPRTVAAVNGVATFAGIAIDRAGAGYTVVASASGLTAATSSPFDVVPGPATQLAFTVPPTTVPAGSPITPAVTVEARDAFGNPTPAFTGSVTVAIGANPGGGTLGGTLTGPAVAGLATFADLTIDRTGQGYTITAASSGLTGATSAPFDVTPIPATLLVFTAQPSAVTAGAPITPAISVTAMDALGNVVTGFTGAVTMALGANPGGGVLSGTTTVNAVAGVATFGDLSIDKAGTGYALVATSAGLTSATSASFDVTAGAAARLVFTQQPPPSLAAGTGFTVVVTAQDGLGNTATGFTAAVTLAFGTHPVGTALTGTTTVAAVAGVATFAGLDSLTVAGGYTLVASAGALSVESAACTVTAGAAAQLAFSVQPSAATVGIVIIPPVVVAIADAFGNPVQTAANGVTIALAANPGGATLGGTRTQTAVAGLATFGDLTLDRVGSGYTFVASAAGLISAASTPFDVVAGPAAALAVSVTPVSDAAGTSRTMVVTAHDALGNVAGGYRGTIHITSTDAQAVLPADYTFTAADSGTHGFGGLILKTAGTPSVTATDLSDGTITGTQTVAVSSAAAATLVFTTQPSTAPVGVAITPPVAVTAEDAFGNVATSFTANVTVALGANPGGASLGGTLSQAAAAGVATFGDLSVNVAGTGYTLTAAAAGLAGGTSQPFAVTLAGAAPNAWTNAAGGAWSVAGNWSLGRVPAPTDSVVISLGGTYTVTLDTTVSVSFLTFGASSGTQTLALSSRTLTITNLTTVEGGSAAAMGGGTLAAAGVANQGSLTLAAAAIDAALTNAGTLVATGASQVAGAVTTVAGDSIIVRGNGVSGAAALTTSGGSWTSNGAIVLTDVTSSYGATLNVAGGSLTNAAAGTIEAAAGAGGDRAINASLDNQGTLMVGTASARALTIAPPAGGSLSNAGTIAITSGTLRVTQTGANPGTTNSGTIQLTGGGFVLNQPAGGTPGTFTSSGAVSIAGGQTFAVSGGAFNVPAGGLITGPGVLSLSSTTANLTPSLNTGSTGLGLLNSTLNGPGTLTNAAGVTLRLQHSTIAAPFVNGGTLVATGASQLTGPVTTVTGDSIIVQGETAFGAATLTVTDANGLTNNGAIVLTDVTSSYGAALAVPAGTLTNAAGATIEAAPGANGDRALNAAVDNQGTLTVGTAAARKLTLAPPAGGSVANGGTIAVNAGSLQVTLSGPNPGMTNAAGGTIHLAGGDVSLSQPSGAAPGIMTTDGAIVITAGRTLAVTGGKLAVNAGATILGPGTLALSGDSASVTPNFSTGTTGLSLLNSVWSGPGILTNDPGATLRLQNSAIASSFTNAGTLVATGQSVLSGSVATVAGDSIIVQGETTFGAATLSVTDATGLTNNGAIVLTDATSPYGATLAVPNGLLSSPAGSTLEAALGANGDRTIAATLDNGGTLTAAAAPGRRLSIAPPAGGEFTNSGTTSVKTGTLEVTLTGANPIATNSGALELTGGDFALTQPSGAFSGTLATPGTLSIGSGRTFSVTGGIFQVPQGATITGPGMLALSSDTAAVNIPDFSTGTTGLSLVNSVWLGSVILTNAPGATLNLQSSEINSGFVNDGTLVASGTSVLSEVSTSSTSLIVVQGDSRVGAASLHVTSLSPMTNNGVVRLTSVGAALGSTLVVDSGFVNAPGATLDVQPGAGGSRTLTAQLDNQELVTVGAPLTINSPTAQHTNSGTLALTGGNVVVQLNPTRGPSFTNLGAIDLGTSTFTVNGGAFTNATGARIQGTGTVDVTASTPSDAGLIYPADNAKPGKLSWTGSLPEQSTALLQFELGGVNQGVNYDFLPVSGAVTFDGTLSVSLIPGFTPPARQVFTLMTYTSFSGKFATTSLPANFGLTIGATALTVTAP